MMFLRSQSRSVLLNYPTRQFPRPLPLIVCRDLSTSIHRRSPDSHNKPPIEPRDKNKEQEEKTGEHHEIQSSHPKTQQSPTDEFLEKIRPHLDSAHRYYLTTKSQVNSLVASLKHHTGKAKEAIRSANEKYEQQEKESASFNFNEDFADPTKKEDQKSTIQGLPSQRERNRKQWAKKLEFYIDSLQETIFTATRALNDVTGYSSIQKLRKSIDALEAELDKSKLDVKTTKENYNEAISKRLLTQKEVNELLQRKSTWTPADLERFTKLYTEDHANALNEENAKTMMEQAEVHQEELYDKLSNAILTRYHEEQIWSDKIRRTSTWGTFGLMGINIFLFLVFQLALEPWKRRRLVGNFEERVQRALEENSNQQNERLDLMSEKMEELKNSDKFPALEEVMEPEVIEDAEVLLIQPPTVQLLPIVVQNRWSDVCWKYLTTITEPLKEPYYLLFRKSYDSTTVTKTEMVSTVSLTLVAGACLGSMLVSLVK